MESRWKFGSWVNKPSGESLRVVFQPHLLQDGAACLMPTGGICQVGLMCLRCKIVWMLKASCPFWQFFFLVIQYTPPFSSSMKQAYDFLFLVFSFKSFPSSLHLSISLTPPASFSPLGCRCLQRAHKSGRCSGKPCNNSLCLCFSWKQESLTVKAPSRALWCRAAVRQWQWHGSCLGVPRCPFSSVGPALPGFRACSLGCGGRSARLSELLIFPFIPG